MDYLCLRIPRPPPRRDGRREAGPNCSFSTRRPHSRPGTARASTAAATTPTPFARRGRGGMASAACGRLISTKCCIAERLDGKAKRLHALPMPFEALPDGAMVQAGDESYLIARGRALLWSLDGYREAQVRHERHASDAAFDAACVSRGIPAGVASERDGAGNLESSFRERRLRRPESILPVLGG